LIGELRFKCLFGSFAIGDVKRILDYRRDMVLIIKNWITVHFNISRIAFLIIMDVLNSYRLFGFYDFLERAGIVNPVTWFISFQTRLHGKQPSKLEDRCGRHDAKYPGWGFRKNPNMSSLSEL